MFSQPSRLATMARERRRQRASTRPTRTESLLSYIPRVSPHLARPDHLARVADVFRRIASGERVRVLLSVPAQHGKTTMVLHGIPWLLEQHPDWPLTYVTYAQDQADTQSLAAQRIARDAGLVTGAERSTLRQWFTRAGGSAFFTGVGGPLTGNPSRLILGDDLLKNRQEADSPLVQGRVMDWFTSVALTRLPEDGSALMVGTRWNENDPAGRLARAGGWEVINLPFLADATGQPDTDGDVVLWPRQTLTNGRSVGWTPEGARERLREVGPYDAASIYQGQPRPRGGQVFRQPDRVAHLDLTGARFAIGCDCAGTDGPDSNHTVLVALAVRGQGESLAADVAGVLRLKLRPEHAAPQVLAWQRSFGGAPLHVEATRDGKALGEALAKIAPGLVIRYVPATGDKFLRAQPSAAAWNQTPARIRVPVDARAMRATTDDDLANFVRVVTAFAGMGDREDDDVDALAHAWEAARHSGPSVSAVTIRGL